MEYEEDLEPCIEDEPNSNHPLNVEDKDLQCDQQRVEKSKNTKSPVNYVTKLERNRSFSM